MSPARSRRSTIKRNIFCLKFNLILLFMFVLSENRQCTRSRMRSRHSANLYVGRGQIITRSLLNVKFDARRNRKPMTSIARVRCDLQRSTSGRTHRTIVTSRRDDNIDSLQKYNLIQCQNKHFE